MRTHRPNSCAEHGGLRSVGPCEQREQDGAQNSCTDQAGAAA